MTSKSKVKMSGVMIIKGTSLSALTKALQGYMLEVVGVLAKKYDFDQEAALKMLGELSVQKEDKLQAVKVQTKGVGAGGSNTNKNGLPYEELTDLGTEYQEHTTNETSSVITFNSYPEIKLILTKQSKMFQCMTHAIDETVIKAHGCKNPDECYIDESKKIIFIIEKKFQQVSGSVCEKIQTPDFKIWQYSRTFPKYKIIYIYCLSSWFEKNCKAELEYLKSKQIQVFWGNSLTYKNDIIQYIISCIQESL